MGGNISLSIKETTFCWNLFEWLHGNIQTFQKEQRNYLKHNYPLRKNNNDHIQIIVEDKENFFCLKFNVYWTVRANRFLKN